ncbi:hypothetical protein SAMN04489752_3631 [Brevibacterium siliguriense]|uniref:Uncharacterized protein n=1 Tax=Brevibacterium siliguriense TaxID=1136497 RepID=A0A1H1YC08_9MICO|nr:hypothetical protein [Brevibacterium siliguriense]SDT19048.1 hypothetical protein SAMN04489752_3631 [Brevibacterium siliguriense]
MKTTTTGAEDLGSVRENVSRVIDETSSLNAELAKELISAYDRESKLLGGINKREKEIERLRTKSRNEMRNSPRSMNGSNGC